MSKIFDVAIVGAGASGLACAYFLKTNNIIILDKYEGTRKLSIVGNNRCNITSTLPYDDFLEEYGKNGQFLRDTFKQFFKNELISWIKELGIETETENTKVFLKNKTSKQFAAILKAAVKRKISDFKEFETVKQIIKENGMFILVSEKGSYKSKALVLACGGKSYPQTGSDGSGYKLAKDLGHTIINPEPMETPFRAEMCCRELQGITLKDVKTTLMVNRKKYTEKGDLVFTHFGVSGPVILKLSDKSFKKATLKIKLIDNCDEITKELHFYKGKVKNFLRQFIPQKLSQKVPHSEEKASNLNKNQIYEIEKFLSSFTLYIRKCGFDKAFVTKGGISLKEVNPKTFGSKIVKNLFFCGEILDMQGNIGGFNLQFAFSSGYSVAMAINRQYKN